MKRAVRWPESAQLSLALAAIRVHCFACSHVVEASTPDGAHDEMEQHYASRHAVLIRSLVDLLS